MAQNLLETASEIARIWPDFIALKTIYPLPLNPLIDLFYELLAQGDCPASERAALLEIVELIQKAPPSQSLAHTNAPRWHSNWMRSTRSKHLNRRISARNRQIHQDEENTPILDRLPAANPTDTTALYAEAQALLTHLQATPTPCPRCSRTENLATPLKRPLDQALMGHPELWHEPDYGYFRQIKARVDGKAAPNLIGEKEKGSASERQNLRRFNLRRSALAAYTLAPFDPELHLDSDGFYSALAGAYHQQFPGIETISVTFFKGGQKDNNGVRSGVLWNALWAQHRGISKLYKTHPNLPTLLLQFPSLPRAVTPPKDEGLKAKRITPMR